MLFIVLVLLVFVYGKFIFAFCTLLCVWIKVVLQIIISNRTIWSVPDLLAKKVRWCTVSDPEQRKCAELAKALVTVLPPAAVTAFAKLSCIRASSTADCIERIRVSRSAPQISWLERKRVQTNKKLMWCITHICLFITKYTFLTVMQNISSFKPDSLLNSYKIKLSWQRWNYLNQVVKAISICHTYFVMLV